MRLHFSSLRSDECGCGARVRLRPINVALARASQRARCAEAGQAGKRRVGRRGGRYHDTPAPAAKPLTLADPALREIVSHFKYPGEAAYGSAPAAVGGYGAGYPPYSFGSVRPYWPPVIVAHPPRPVVPFLSPLFSPFFVPAAAPLFLAPPLELLWPGW